MSCKYIKTLPNGETEGVHPDELAAEDFLFTESGFKAIRAKCLDCAHNIAEVRRCTVYECPLWAFRLGRNPKALKTKRGKAT